MTMILLSASALAASAYALGRYVGMRNSRATRYRLSVAKELAAKHECLMRQAVEPLRSLSAIADKAGMAEDAAKLKTLANTMAYAVGMSRKIGG